MAKAKHFGTCQVCGRKQAYDGSMAKHGYVVDYGFFSGTCNGSDRKALEEDKTLTEETIQALQTEISRMQAIVDNGQNNIALVRIQVYNKALRQYLISWQNAEDFKATMKCPEFFENEWSDAQRNTFYFYSNAINQMQHNVEFLKEMIKKVHGKPLQDRTVEETEKPTKELFSDYRTAYARKVELEKECYKVTLRRQRYGGHGLTYRKG